MDIGNSFGHPYFSPVTQVIEITSEGLICASGDQSEQTEPLDEILGQW